MKTVVITGVSTGIGYDAARYLLANGYRVWGSVRRQADADKLQAELGPNFSPLLFDVTDEEGIRTAVAQLAEQLNGRDREGRGLNGLINNAGIAVSGPLMHMPLDKFRHQLEINLVGALAVTQAFLPLLGARPNPGHPPGRIVNISSVSGSIVYPFFGPYAASKHGLEVISHAFRRELRPYGIDVVIISPGSVQTPIWEKAEEEDLGPYADTIYELMLARLQKSVTRIGKAGIPVELVSQTIFQALESPRPKARYVLARNLWTGWLIPRWLPSRWFDRIVAKRMGLDPE
jgi:NAD(P)-dependent dehydrogenase (short-subunit alcohol dehydrogenase family)